MNAESSRATTRSVISSVRRLKAAPSVKALANQMCTELCDTVGFNRAVFSSVTIDTITPVAAHGTRGTGMPIQRSSCIAEQDCVKFRRIVHAGTDEAPATIGFRELLDTAEYLVAPIVVESKVLALLHLSRTQEVVAGGDVDTVGLLLLVYSIVHERLVNSQRVEQLRISIGGAASGLAEEVERIGRTDASLAAATASGGGRLRPDVPVDRFAEALSKREREVFERMLRGDSNAEIAAGLVVSVETVKSHVKRILRKIGAANRLEAISLSHGRLL